jgi:hypothetical protein
MSGVVTVSTCPVSPNTRSRWSVSSRTSRWRAGPGVGWRGWRRWKCLSAPHSDCRCRTRVSTWCMRVRRISSAPVVKQASWRRTGSCGRAARWRSSTWTGRVRRTGIGCARTCRTTTRTESKISSPPRVFVSAGSRRVGVSTILRPASRSWGSSSARESLPAPLRMWCGTTEIRVHGAGGLSLACPRKTHRPRAPRSGFLVDVLVGVGLDLTEDAVE